MINNSCENVSKHTGGILGLAIAIISLSIIYMVYRAYMIFQSGYPILHPTVYQTVEKEATQRTTTGDIEASGRSNVAKRRSQPVQEVEMTDMAPTREVVNVKVRENPSGWAQRPKGALQPGAAVPRVTDTSSVFRGVRSAF